MITWVFLMTLTVTSPEGVDFVSEVKLENIPTQSYCNALGAHAEKTAHETNVKVEWSCEGAMVNEQQQLPEGVIPPEAPNT